MVIRDTVHGNIELSDNEVKLVSHPYFERLRYIKQLSFSEYDFPCATHNRYTHSLGVCQCVTDMYKSVCKNMPTFYREGDLELLRMMALVHDLCHSPFSHASEDLSPLSHEERLTEALSEMNSCIDIPNWYNIPNWELVDQVYQGYGGIFMRDKHLITLHNFMDGIVDADKLDYLERDAFFCGVKYGHFDRLDLVNNLTIINDDLGILSDGLASLENFILARYYMFSEVYFHPVERIRRFCYCNEMKKLLKDGIFPEDIKKYMQLDDTKYIHRLKFLKGSGTSYELVFDTNFNPSLKELIDRYVSSDVVCDTPSRSIFRSNEGDTNIMVYDKDMGIAMESTKLSPILGGIEYTYIHKLRYYAHRDIANSVKEKIGKVVKQYYGNI